MNAVSQILHYRFVDKKNKFSFFAEKFNLKNQILT